MKKAFLLATILLLILASSVSARPPTAGSPDFTWHRNEIAFPARWVEQQAPTLTNFPFYCASSGTCVENHTGCIWSADDYVRDGAYGNLAAGSTQSFSECLIADRFQRWIAVSIESDSNSLLVNMSFSPQEQTFNITPLLVNGEYHYEGCVLGPFYSDQSEGQPIPNSNGGWGVPTTAYVSVTNPTNKTLRRVLGTYTIGWYFGDQYCRQPVSDVFVAGGALWKVGI